jgi:hypothetical protein
MRSITKCILLTTAVLLALASCAVFTFGVNDLKGKTLTYSVNLDDLNQVTLDELYTPNGYDNVVLTFDDTGAAGSFTVAYYMFEYASAAACASGEYSQKTWYQYGGGMGTFTYDPDGCLLTLTTTSVYAPSASAIPFYDPAIGEVYAASDYSYQPLNDWESAQTGMAITDAALTKNYTLSLTVDSLKPVWVATSGSGTWAKTSVTTETMTRSGSAYSKTFTLTYQLTVASGTLNQFTQGQTVTSLGSTTTMFTYGQKDPATILHFFIVGKDDAADQTFEDAWKKGNTVTFQGIKSEWDSYNYYGSTMPDPPTVIDPSGVGSSDGTDGSGNPYHYYVIKYQNPVTLTLTNEGSFISVTKDADYASRGVMARPRG